MIIKMLENQKEVFFRMCQSLEHEVREIKNNWSMQRMRGRSNIEYFSDNVLECIRKF